jgi:hypothetical protein
MSVAPVVGGPAESNRGSGASPPQSRVPTPQVVNHIVETLYLGLHAGDGDVAARRPAITRPLARPAAVPPIATSPVDLVIPEGIRLADRPLSHHRRVNRCLNRQINDGRRRRQKHNKKKSSAHGSPRVVRWDDNPKWVDGVLFVEIFGTKWVAGGST